MVEPDRPQVDNIIWRMRSAYGLTQATDTHTHTHTEYVTLLALPRQHRLGERTFIRTLPVMLGMTVSR